MIFAAGAILVAVLRPLARSSLVLAAVLLALAPPAAANTPLFGVTVDRVPHPDRIAAALARLPERPTTRIYFDVHEPAGYYATAVHEIGAVSGVMGELLDSSDERRIATAQLDARVRSYLEELGGSVGIWEVGNEVNGNWTGPYEEVAAKLDVAYEDVHAAGGSTALTLYENAFGPEHCGDGEGELTPLQFSERYVPASVAAGLDYVLLSYYPTQCGGRMPTSLEVAVQLEALHALYPHALLGFGEVGLPHSATRRTLQQAQAIMSWAYSLNPGLPYYAGGYFWWYGYEDALKPKAKLAGSLPAAFEAEAAALGG